MVLLATITLYKVHYVRSERENANMERPTSAEIISSEKLTKHLIDYLYTLFPDYQVSRNMPWTREDNLNARIRSDNQSHTLREYLTQPKVDEKIGHVKFLVVRGEKEGDGKKFYILKLLEACYSAIPHITWDKIDDIIHNQDKGNLFRIPVLLEKKKHATIIAKFLQQMNTHDPDVPMQEIIVSLLSEAIASNSSVNNPSAKEIIATLVKKLIDRHMLIVFFQEGAVDKPAEEAKRIRRLCRNVLSPVFVFVIDRSADEQITETDNDDFFFVNLQPLNKKQILRYIAIELPENDEIYVKVK